jgi:hypothetical protein
MSLTQSFTNTHMSGCGGACTPKMVENQGSILVSQDVSCSRVFYLFSLDQWTEFYSLHNRIVQLQELYDDARFYCYNEFECENGCCCKLLTFQDFRVIRNYVNNIEWNLIRDLDLNLRTFDLSSLLSSIEKTEEKFSIDYAQEFESDILQLGKEFFPIEIMKLVMSFLEDKLPLICDNFESAYLNKLCLFVK